MDWIGMGIGAEPRPGAEATADIVVSQADLASELNLSDDDCFPAVFATSRMIALMELAAARVINPWLKPGELSVGVTVEITHTSATPTGTVVGADAKYLGRDGKLYVFEVVAMDEGGEIGRGFHKRAVVDTERLMAGALRRVAPVELPRERRARRGLFSSLLAAALLALGVGSAGAQMTAPHRADSATVTPGAEYRAGWLHRALLGTRYRKLWGTPVDAPVLDLDAYPGGLTMTRLGGGQQTASLRFADGSGKRYVFRTVRKDPTNLLPPDLRGTVAHAILLDQMSAGFPYGAAVVDQLLPAAEAPSLAPRLVVLPDDARLGEHRSRFAGALGFFEELPADGSGGRPGFAGFTSIVSTDEMIARRRKNGESVDVTAYLAARILDIYVGDWDRHRDQWRWGRTDRNDPWRPIPRDRDQAFARFDGLLLSIARETMAEQLVEFEAGSIPVEGLTWNGRDLDRELLPRLEWRVWDSVTTAVVSRLTDQLIYRAVAALPAGAETDGSWLGGALTERRERLPKAVREHWLRLNRELELHATDRAERIVVTGGAKGSLTLVIDGGSDGSRIVRTFDPKTTGEVRLYLHDGADTVAVTGESSPIRLRLIDDRGRSAIVRSGGPEVEVHHDGLATRPLPTPGSDPAPRDWGSRSYQFPIFSSTPDAGFVIGRGLTRFDYGFGKTPYASKLTAQASFGTGNTRPGIELSADVRTTNPVVRYRIDVAATGVGAMRWYGMGNETVAASDASFHRIQNWKVSVAPAIELAPDRRLSIRVGPTVRYVDARSDSTRLVGQEMPYGADGFGMIAGTASVTWDSRDLPANARRGFLLTVRGEAAPAAWDAEEAFGSVAGEARTYWSPASAGGPTVALRAGGSRSFGTYPFFEAASVGGSETIRGFSEDRFRGQGAVYGGAELRVPVGPVRVIIPGQLGLIGFADGGRVYQDGETSSKWHTGFGGGVWLSWLGPANTLSAVIGKSEEQTAIYLKFGMSY